MVRRKDKWVFTPRSGPLTPQPPVPVSGTGRNPRTTPSDTKGTNKTSRVGEGAPLSTAKGPVSGSPPRSGADRSDPRDGRSVGPRRSGTATHQTRSRSPPGTRTGVPSLALVSVRTPTGRSLDLPRTSGAAPVRSPSPVVPVCDGTPLGPPLLRSGVQVDVLLEVSL